MRFRVISRYMGMVLLLEALFMLIAAGIAQAEGPDGSFIPLLYSFGITTVAAGLLIAFGKKQGRATSKEGYFIVIGSWLLSCLVGTIPYLLWGGDFDFVNAWFESVSGFTTTGATIIEDVEILPRGLLFWRSTTHWIGGVGVVMFTLTIMPTLGSTRMTLSNVEISQLAKDNYNYRTRKVIRILLFVYIGMTLANLILLRIFGMNWFDAINHAFSIISTGGFSTKNTSIAAYDNLGVEIVTTVFSFIAGIHFGLIFATLIGKHKNMFRSEVVRYYFFSVAACILFMSLNLWKSGVFDSFGESLRHGSFQAVTIVSTTGFATADSALWPTFSIAILFLLSIQCACAGSTSGGLKSDRVLLSLKVMKVRIRRLQHPNAIIRIKMDGVAQDESAVNFAVLYVVIYFFIILLGMLLYSLAGLDFVTSLSASASCMGNVGPGFGEVGSMSTFFGIPATLKVLSSILMLLGRLEIFGLIQLFITKWWV